MGKQYIIITILIIIFSYAVYASCGPVICQSCGTYTNRTEPGQYCCNYYSSDCANYNVCNIDECQDQYILKNARGTDPQHNCVGSETINCLEYGEYCKTINANNQDYGICAPCVCEQEEGECCNVATSLGVTRGCLFEAADQGCKIINNVPAGTCTGVSSICPIFDENTIIPELSQTIGYCELSGYGWNNQIPANYDYPIPPNQSENTQGSCCGDDDIIDSGLLGANGKFLCTENKDLNTWSWHHVNQTPGNIYQIEHPTNNIFDALSDGSKWYACNNEFRKDPGQKVIFNQQILAGHHYICYNDNNYPRFAECKGDGNSYNANEGFFGKSNSTGNYLIIDSTRFYCTDSYEWTDNLDGTSKNTCEKAFFQWTGSKCCGDTSYTGQLESYNDNKDACIKDNKVANNTKYTTQPEAGKIMVLDGQFYSCQLNNWQDYRDTTTNQDLLINLDYCQSKGDFFCDPNTDEWNDELAGTESAGLRNTTKSYTFPNGATSTSCCPPDWCWDGSLCIPNQAANASIPDQEQDQYERCVNGEWTTSYIAKTWNNLDKGLCPESSDCLVDPLGDYSSNYIPENYGTDNGNPQCISNNQAVLDHYCNNRQWTSRTKSIANQLIGFAGNSYILFCDKYTTSLNDFSYGTIEDYLGGPEIWVMLSQIRACRTPSSYLYQLPCINNFCILSSGNNLMFGTSLNQPINTDSSILEVLGFNKDDCNAISGNTFQKCSNNGEYGGEVWYNPQLNSIIYSKLGISSQPELDITQDINNIINEAKTISAPIIPTPPYSWIKAKDYNKIYINKNPNQQIIGIYETTANQDREETYLAIGYKNFDYNICDTIDRYRDNFPGRPGIHCKKEGDDYYIASSTTTIENIWPELTSKIRLS